MEFIVTGKTVEKALSQGLKQHKLSLHEVEVEILDVGEKRLFSSRAAVVKIKLKPKDKQVTNEYSAKMERTNKVEQKVRELPTEDELLEMIVSLPDDINSPINGTAEIADGKFTVTDPENDGKYAVIVIPGDITLLIDGKEKKGSVVVTSKNEISVKMEHREPSRQLDIRVDVDSMTASIRVVYQSGDDYQLIDSQKETKLYVTTAKNTITAEKFSLTEVSHQLTNKGIVYGIDWTLLTNILQEGDGEWHIFAKGIPPVNGEDGKLYLLYDSKKTSQADGRYTNIKEILSVQEGEVLARIIEPKLGKAGTNIYGNSVPWTPGKKMVVKPGEGVAWMEEIEAFVSTSSGRPLVKGDVLEILPCHYIHEDVHYADGGLNFSGDVVINGSVHEGVKIQAGGNISIYGNTHFATIEAQGSVTITKQVVGGTIKAGASSMCFIQAEGFLRELLQTWRNLELSLEQLNNVSAFKQQDLLVRGYGQLIKLLLESKFKNIAGLARKMLQHYEANESMLKHTLLKTITSVEGSLLGLGPLKFRSKEELDDEVSKWRDALHLLQEMMKSKENIQIGSAFNSKIWSSGDIIVSDWGAHSSHLVAGKSIFVQGKPGIVRGGTLQASETVKVNEVGSSMGAKTMIELPPKGTFEANKVYPNTRVKKGLVEKEYSGIEGKVLLEA